jgi:hypothetical protein
MDVRDNPLLKLDVNVFVFCKRFNGDLLGL